MSSTRYLWFLTTEDHLLISFQMKKEKEKAKKKKKERKIKVITLISRIMKSIFEPLLPMKYNGSKRSNTFILNISNEALDKCLGGQILF